MLFGKQKWTSQPQFSTGINQELVSKGLTSVYTPSIGLVLVKNMVPVFNGGVITASEGGVAFRTTGGTANAVTVAESADDVIGLASGAIFMYFRFRDTTARAAQIAGYYTATTAQRALLQPYSDGNFYFDWGGAVNNGGRVSVAYSKHTRPQCVTGVSGGGKGKELWFGGAKVASNATDSTARPSGSQNFRFGTASSEFGGASDAIDLYLCATFNKALSDTDIRNISANPWQLFSPRLV